MKDEPNCAASARSHWTDVEDEVMRWAQCAQSNAFDDRDPEALEIEITALRAACTLVTRQATEFPARGHRVVPGYIILRMMEAAAKRLLVKCTELGVPDEASAYLDGSPFELRLKCRAVDITLSVADSPATGGPNIIAVAEGALT